MKCNNRTVIALFAMHFSLWSTKRGRNENMHVNNNSNEVRTKHEIKGEKSSSERGGERKKTSKEK